MWRRSLLFAGLLPLAACGSLFPYESTGSCPQMGQGVCASVREVYHATEKSDHVEAAPLPPPAAATGLASGARSVAAGVSAPTAPAQPVQPPATPATAAEPASRNPDVLPVTYAGDGSLPLRTPAEVMRIWIAPWVTSDGDLMMSGYVMTELRERTWQVGGQAVGAVTDLRPVSFDRLPAAVPTQNESAPPLLPSPSPGSGIVSARASASAAPSISMSPVPTVAPSLSPPRPVVRAATGAQPGAPEGGFWQTAPGMPPVQ
jgi:conjugal transfer pilus assembly protein TraV